MTSDEEKGTQVNVVLDSDGNDLLTKSAKSHDRSKRKEASRRLKDHLLRFDETWQERTP